MSKEGRDLLSLYREGVSLLSGAGCEEAASDVWLLFSHVFGLTRAQLYAYPEAEADPLQEEVFSSLLKKRLSHEPVQYLTGEAFFFGRSFFVTPAVLIPRMDTEVLVEKALAYVEELSREGKEAPRILDLCTGSGIILLTLLLEKEDASGVGTDLSPQALEVARENGRRLLKRDELELQNRIDQNQINQESSIYKKESSIYRKESSIHTYAKEQKPRALFLEGDLFDIPALEGESFDLITANPPYIESREIEGLMEEVRGHEPRLALDGGEDGLDFYRRILSGAKAFLKPSGGLFLEIGCSQGEVVRKLALREGYENVKVTKDLAGLDRVVSCRKGKGEPSHTAHREVKDV